MLFTLTHGIEAAIFCMAIVVGWLAFRNKLGKGFLRAMVLLLVWLGIFSVYLSVEMTSLSEQVSLTALNKQDENAQGCQIIASSCTVDGEEFSLLKPVEGKWAWYEEKEGSGKFYAGWIPGNERQPQDATNSITLEIPVGRNRFINFQANPGCGYVEIKACGEIVVTDTYSDNTAKISVSIPDSSPEMLAAAQRAQFPYCLGIFLICTFIVFGTALYLSRRERPQKLEKYKFLFRVLVKRDFTTKYKRTILGAFWSVLSPLMNLLIMWIVFAKLFGSNVNHFAIYMFIGNIVFTFFSDATSQGMTSLLDNAAIFTKVNVPKYMFVLSKNVSSLINYGLTLILLFFFVAIEGLPFTGKYLMLIFPIACQILFNVGLGLVLSALQVFFRDMQYLWGIMTQLIMWLSAIFYSIDNYNQVGRNLFLANPIYLFIRYFRKVIIDGSIPSLWFHLLMAGYTCVVLVVGFRMYRKFNREFLYYV